MPLSPYTQFMVDTRVMTLQKTVETINAKATLPRHDVVIACLKLRRQLEEKFPEIPIFDGKYSAFVPPTRKE